MSKPDWRFLARVYVLLTFGCIVLNVQGTEAFVKKSSSGICHCPGSTSYARTTNFTEFDDLKSCLDSGGREPARGQGDCGPESDSNQSNSTESPSQAPNLEDTADVSTQESQEPVKKSSSGICHCPGSSSYKRTTNFTEFDTLESCIESGGREPARGQGECPQPAASKSSSSTGAPKTQASKGVESTQNAELPVKKSSSGICHCPGSSSYKRTSNFTPYSSIEACLESGGREPTRGQGDCELVNFGQEPKVPNYDRDKFGAWIDSDDDCQNTRTEVLIAFNNEEITSNEASCYLGQGSWVGFYTGQTFSDASSIDIDHVVPLKFAWVHGAYAWSEEERMRFANDPANLLPVSASSNRSKGSRGPSAWLPEDSSFHCEYILRFLRVVNAYDLKLSAEEDKSLTRLTEIACDRSESDAG